jgi:hypothetical protein
MKDFKLAALMSMSCEIFVQVFKCEILWCQSLFGSFMLPMEEK